MFPHRWQDFACKRNKSGFVEYGSGWNDVEFHHGITWSSSEPYWCRRTERYWDASKVGCDYAHLSDREYGQDDYLSVQRDAELTVENFISFHPDFEIMERSI